MPITSRHRHRAAAALVAAATATAGILACPPAAQALTLPAGPVAPRTQIAIINFDGQVSATPGATAGGPALSLAKLYLGYWVLAHGDVADRAKVPAMIRFSDDRIAAELDARYPHAIGEIMAQYGLNDSHPGSNWGHATTSTMDVARFLNAVRSDPTAAPMLQAMATAAPIAADGYHQDYGTSRIPGVWATKYGWSDHGDVNATASIGPDYVIVARTYGPADQLTGDLAGLIVGTATTPPAGGVAQMPWLFGTTPATTGAQVRAQVACADPLGLRMLLPEQSLVPQFLAELLPHCA
ncbi:hypothetical protein C1Y63_11820 [Corynebacterium sp. 13CS0277]|uniref:hypothetical protein n=1 Tax=Corynebacterium sp. 13CS0277 TaxID=2071994 RepID=UPI000D03EB24|nr:hypothetical protein [Corynebacterium sp. 13CS0277]PRQ10379.1 hypothetical protein C1Y63_11820 [Corynebacterium sp. 13CS0277]